MFFLWVILLAPFTWTAPLHAEDEWMQFFSSDLVPATKMDGYTPLNNPFYTLKIPNISEDEQPFSVNGFDFLEDDSEAKKGHSALPAAPFIATMFTEVKAEQLSILLALKFPKIVRDLLPSYLKPENEPQASYFLVMQAAPGHKTNKMPNKRNDTDSMTRRYTPSLKTHNYFRGQDFEVLPDNTTGKTDLTKCSIEFLDTQHNFVRRFIPKMLPHLGKKQQERAYFNWLDGRLFYSHTPASCIAEGKSFDMVEVLWNQNSVFWSKLTRCIHSLCSIFFLSLNYLSAFNPSAFKK